MKYHQSWKEIDSSALKNNIGVFKNIVGDKRKLLVVVKSNAYGHGMIPVAEIAAQNGADWLGVFTLDEAIELRKNNITTPILVFGPVLPEGFGEASAENTSVTISSLYALKKLVENDNIRLKIHLKLETGTNRQGFQPSELIELAEILNKNKQLTVEGAYTHFADIEDTTDHSFAELQLKRFKDSISVLEQNGIKPEILHTACTAATILFEDTLFNMARVGIGTYGLWPSRETFVSAHQYNRQHVTLHPVLSWKTLISQIKELEAGEYVGYGRTFRTTRKTRLAILPIGYSNGYPRRLSGQAYVLVAGKRAPVVGRIMMNMTLVDVTDINDAEEMSEVVLIGSQNQESVTAENLANWIGSINYEIVTRAEPFGKIIVK